MLLIVVLADLEQMMKMGTLKRGARGV